MEYKVEIDGGMVQFVHNLCIHDDGEITGSRVGKKAEEWDRYFVVISNNVSRRELDKSFEVLMQMISFLDFIQFVSEPVPMWRSQVG